MDFLSRDDLRKLVSHSKGACVSIYLPTRSAAGVRMQDPIGLKNLLREADEGLRASGMAGDESATLLWPAHELLKNYDFWQHHSDGLALFLAEDLFRTYRVQLKVPELVVVAERFHVNPLLAGMNSNGHFYVLAVSQKRVYLFRGTRESFAEVEVDGLPGIVLEGPQYELVERHLQPQPAGLSSGSRSVLSRHTMEDPQPQECLKTYLRKIDHAIRKHLLKDPGPLILATVEYLYPLYRRVSSIVGLSDRWIFCNPDEILPHELHRQASAIALAYFHHAESEARDQYLALWHTQRASNILSDVLPAALEGRVQSLFVAAGAQVWGHLDNATNEGVIADAPTPGDCELLNLAAAHAYISGGTIYVIPPAEVPGGGDIAAVFRY